MKSLRIVVLAVLVVLSTVLALADSIPARDPVIRTGGGTASVPITSPIFEIFTPTGSSPTDGSECSLIQDGISTPAPGCFFLNDIETGKAINALLFVASKADFSGNLSCALSTALGGTSPWFTRCSFSTARGLVEFYGGPGIPFGKDFSMGFRGFNPDTAFVVTATNTPEPGTLALLVGGIGALLVRRRSPSNRAEPWARGFTTGC